MDEDAQAWDKMSRPTSITTEFGADPAGDYHVYHRPAQKIECPTMTLRDPGVKERYQEAITLLRYVTEGRLDPKVLKILEGWKEEDAAAEDGMDQDHVMTLLLMIMREIIYVRKEDVAKGGMAASRMKIEVGRVTELAQASATKERDTATAIQKLAQTILPIQALLAVDDKGVTRINAMPVDNDNIRVAIKEIQATWQTNINDHKDIINKASQRFAEIQESIKNITQRVGEMATLCASQGQAIMTLRANQDSTLDALRKNTDKITVVKGSGNLDEAAVSRVWKEGFEPAVALLKRQVDADMQKVQDACHADIEEIKDAMERLRQDRPRGGAEDMQGIQPAASQAQLGQRMASLMGEAVLPNPREAMRDVENLRMGAEAAERKDREEEDFVKALVASRKDKVQVLAGSHRCLLCGRRGHYAADCRAQCYCPVCQEFGTHPVSECPHKELARTKQCSKCQTYGHDTRDCKGLVDVQGNLTSRKPFAKDGKLTCFNCGKPGHMAKKCPEPKKMIGPGAPRSKNGRRGPAPGKQGRGRKGKNQTGSQPQKGKGGPKPRREQGKQQRYQKGQRVAEFAAYPMGYPAMMPYFPPAPAMAPGASDKQALMTALAGVLAQFRGN